MSDNPFYSDDPTEKMPPREPSQPNQQGKLILGGFQNSPKRPDRKPYQYTPQPPSSDQQIEPPVTYPQRRPGSSYQNQGQPVQPVWRIEPSSQPQHRPSPASQGQPIANPQHQPASSYPYQAQPAPSPYPVSPGSPATPGYPPSQPGQVPGGPTPPPRLPRRKRGRRPVYRRKGCMISMLVVLVLLIVFISFAATTLQKVFAFGSAISTQKNALSTQTGYMATSDRVNILVMGYGGSGHDGAYLTDSMMIMSLLPQSHHTTLISVPRDLWVQNPANSGNYSKINAVYPVAAGDNNQNPIAGGDAAAQKVSLITGLNVQYWVTINFVGFRDFINAIGGVDVYVPDSFSANYPINDDPSINAGWKVVKFTKGTHHMDGETAIEYARARYVIDNPAEGTDFARSARQQIIIKAALSKVKNIGTWPHIYSALDALQHTIYTNLSLADLAEFALHMDLDNAHHVGISTSNVLVNATSNDGQAILLPANNNWQAIIDYVKQQLYN